MQVRYARLQWARAEDLLEIAAGVDRRLDAEERVDDLGHLLLEGRADVLDHGRFEVRVLAGLEHEGDRERHLPQGGEMRDEAPHRGRGALARILRHLADQLEQQREAREVALRAAALEGELGRHLLPARALLADPHVLGHEDVLEDDHVEVMRAGQVDDRAHRDAGELRVHQELRESLVLLRRIVVRPERRDQVVGEMGIARPDLGAVDLVAAGDALGARTQRREVGARVGLAHADRERQLAAGDRRQEPLPLRLGAKSKQERAGLAVGDPVGRHRRSGRQHLLEHHVALERAPLVTAVALGPRHGDPAARAHLLAELAVEAAPRVRAPHRRGVAQLVAQELAHLPPQGLRLRRQLAQLEAEGLHAHAYDSRLRSSTKSPCVS